MTAAPRPFELFENPHAVAGSAYGASHRRVLDPTSAEAAWREVTAWPGYAPTPLVRLPGFARRAGLGEVLYKDEAERFGLGSFKALGGAYAVFRHLAASVAARTGTQPTAAELVSGAHRGLTSTLTVCCATDGNHGRSVAWGAAVFGCRCVVYIHATVSESRARSIAERGAEVVRHPGNYDEAVRRAADDASANGWTVVSDTSYEGYTDIPRDVMHGYTVMVEEVVRELGEDEWPSHVFVQGGVGGLAAAACARLWWEPGRPRPRCVVVEPQRAACLLATARAGRRVALEGDIETVMAGLSCGEASLLAWEILRDSVDVFMTLPDEAAMEMMRTLAGGLHGDPPLVAGESAVAGIAGLAALAADETLARRVGLDAESRVLVFGTEGATDPELYRRIVGRSPEEVRAA